MVISKTRRPLINTKCNRVISTTINTSKICKGNLVTIAYYKQEFLTVTIAKVVSVVAMSGVVMWISTVTKMAWRCRIRWVRTKLSVQYRTKGACKLQVITLNRVVACFQAWQKVAEDSVKKSLRSLAALNKTTQSLTQTATKIMTLLQVLAATIRCKVTELRCMIKECPFQVLKTFELTFN